MASRWRFRKYGSKSPKYSSLGRFKFLGGRSSKNPIPSIMAEEPPPVPCVDNTSCNAVMLEFKKLDIDLGGEAERLTPFLARRGVEAVIATLSAWTPLLGLIPVPGLQDAAEALFKAVGHFRVSVVPRTQRCVY
jgi:hypothetical protein